MKLYKFVPESWSDEWGKEYSTKISSMIFKINPPESDPGIYRHPQRYEYCAFTRNQLKKRIKAVGKPEPGFLLILDVPRKNITFGRQQVIFNPWGK